ncbi:peptidase S8/S53 domain-containing protein, partial [Thamnocephalis sphaerospora]
FTGKGITVGIIDSGIDYGHTALGGCFGSGCKVAFGYDFVGDDYTASNRPKPDDDPMDTCNGHGTHVAGIIAGQQGSFAGVAPQATLGAYRVFGCTGRVELDVVLDAI